MSKTVRVRIAVAVDEHGQWCAAAWRSNDDVRNAREAHSFLDDETSGDEDRHVVYVEADVPLPSSVTVQGEVKK